MNEWYSELDPEEMTGKHVRVQFDNGIVFEGPLVYDELNDFVRLGPMRTVPCTEGLPVEETGTPPVLTRSSDGHWHPFSDVKSIALVWDERDWEPVEPADAVVGDAIVVNGRLWKINHIDAGSNLISVSRIYSYTLDPSMVSVFLRSLSSVPTRPGFYRDKHGKYWARAFKNGGWYRLDPGDETRTLPSEFMDLYMPLTRVEAEFKEVD